MNKNDKNKKKGSQLIHGFSKIKESTSRTSLALVFAVVVFFVLLIAVLLAVLIFYLFTEFGLITGGSENLDLVTVALIMAGISVFMGFFIAFFLSRIPLKPINNIINKLNRLASGDFKARLEFGPTLSAYPAFKEISTSFNKMAEELEKTEMLRNDFINNFSHEFKTPIVSIAGFAKLLSKGNLTESQRAEYYSFIEKESMRLSNMATNVLNLTRVENQTILTDIKKFNLSEQLRSAVLVLEGKWVSKSIEVNIDLEEYDIYANEELLKQVWINLIDNAIKFSPENAPITIEIKQDEKRYEISVENTGNDIPQDKMQNIFNKFYQADESHATHGNGIGLAIVKKVVTLHNGDIKVESKNGVTKFRVILPKKQ